jgi:hypothetical protein
VAVSVVRLPPPKLTNPGLKPASAIWGAEPTEDGLTSIKTNWGIPALSAVWCRTRLPAALIVGRLKESRITGAGPSPNTSSRTTPLPSVEYSRPVPPASKSEPSPLIEIVGPASTDRRWRSSR